MSVVISFDPADADDVAYVLGLVGPAEEEEAPEPTPAPKKAAAKKAAKPAPEPEEEPADADLMQTAVDKATEMVAEGRQAEVKGALANFGVKRVSELEEGQLQEFLDALDEESPV